MSDTPGVPGGAAGLRAANSRLRELLSERDAEIAVLRSQVAEIAELRAQVAVLKAQVADLAARVSATSENSSRPPSSDGLAKPAPKSLRKKTGRKPGRPKGQPGATMQLSDHPDHVIRHEPGCCAGCARDLAGAEEAGAERRQVTEIPPVKAEVTEHRMIGLPSFAGIACHGAWKPYDSYASAAGHALCNAHVLRELIAVTETGTEQDVTWAHQAIDALLALKDAAGAARAAGQDAIDLATLDKHAGWFRDAAAAGIVLNAARGSKLQKKRHALATRMHGRHADYLRFAHDLRVPFDNNQAEQVIRMSKLRIKVSGCMRSMQGAETFCTIRSYLATAARHGTSWLDALTRAAEGHPWIPDTT